jgi:hypothetical protein
MNRYLVDETGAAVGSRGMVTLRTFAPLLIAAALGVGAAIAGGARQPAVAGLCAIAALLCFLAGPTLMWRAILKAGRELDRATDAWRAGDARVVIPIAHDVLRTVFRADMRARAFHLLGLAAEQAADFAEAIELFDQAEQAMPAMAAPMRKRDARLLMDAHRALAMTALGRLDQAGGFIARSFADLAQSGQGGVIDALTDDGTWGIGSVSMNEVLMKLEGKRPPRALLGLAAAYHSVARGAQREAHQLLSSEGPAMAYGLTPKELAFAHALHRLCEQGPAALQGPSGDAWIDGCLSALQAHSPLLRQ